MAGRQVQAHHAAMATPSWREIGVLTRDNAHAADVFDALTAAGDPGRDRRPAGAAAAARGRRGRGHARRCCTTSPPTPSCSPCSPVRAGRSGRATWRCSGRARRRLAGRAPRAAARDVAEELARRPSPAPTRPRCSSLSDALEDPGEAAYSDEARERFALLAGELRYLRAHAGEPLLDLVRRIIDTAGIDVELAAVGQPGRRRPGATTSTCSSRRSRSSRPSTATVTLPALLAYLQAEDEFGNGLDVATPTEADSVKLLTVHRAKGLEWDAVFLVGVCGERFPTPASRTKWTAAPACCPTRCAATPATCPSCAAPTRPALTPSSRQAPGRTRPRRSCGSATSPFTRARHLLVGLVVLLEPAAQDAAGALALPGRRCATRSPRWGRARARGGTSRRRGRPTRCRPLSAVRPWPVDRAHRGGERRLAAAELVAGRDGRRRRGPAADARASIMIEAAGSASGTTELERLLAEARRGPPTRSTVPLPSSLSATALARLRDDPDGVAADLARPMPRRPSPSARFGTRFHAWVEARFGQQQLIDPDDLPAGPTRRSTTTPSCAS